MKKTVGFDEAVNSLVDTNSFSRSGAEALVEYLEALEDDTGEEIEFDPIGFRCEFSEYPNVNDAASDFGWDKDTDCSDPRRWLEHRTTVIDFDGGVIVRVF